MRSGRSADRLSAEVFIRPLMRYSSVVDVAKQEQNDDTRPVLTTHIKNLDKFDTIFIGYPTWWTDLPK